MCNVIDCFLFISADLAQSLRIMASIKREIVAKICALDEKIERNATQCRLVQQQMQKLPQAVNLLNGQVHHAGDNTRNFEVIVYVTHVTCLCISLSFDNKH